MEFIELEIHGCFEVKNFYAEDSRGFFTKTIHKHSFQEAGFETNFKESYYSLSLKNVIRGMHFQIPPADHYKLVYCVSGKILDVVVDLRKSSSTYKKVIAIELFAGGSSIYIPKGCAHGFLSLEDNTITVYNVSTVYAQDFDSGVLWSSIDFDWNITNPILSARDQSFVKFNDYQSPFK